MEVKNYDLFKHTAAHSLSIYSKSPFFCAFPGLQTDPETTKLWETKFSANSRAVEFCSVHTLRECCLFLREEGCSDRHDQDFSRCGWAVMHNVSAAFVHLLQCLAEKETIHCLQEK